MFLLFASSSNAIIIFARMDDQHKNDAQDDSDKGCEKVVNNCTCTHLSRVFRVQRCQTWTRRQKQHNDISINQKHSYIFLSTYQHPSSTIYRTLYLLDFYWLDLREVVFMPELFLTCQHTRE